ncbi:lipopolysaccharide biosynthesis protein [Robertmurraya korlensis]|uniref:lipopolysaccharide biosynthesis protein n=1 Tax=Robertmurraya korlensis TaxID=519977 RepID=UPI00082672ED|nr:polysaccharide biosynthesis C-terminal domain-containing protein [Robertmurraya korlensis]
MVEVLTKLTNKFKNENSKIILNNAIGAMVIKGGGIIVSFLTFPAYMEYFSSQPVLGLWFTVLSVLSWILTFDLGIGNGLRNHLVPTLINNDTIKTKKYVSSAYVAIAIVVIFSMITAFIVFRFVDWNYFFNISTDVVSRETLNKTVLLVFSGIMLQFLLKLITSILYAMQRSALNNLLGLISNFLILVYVSFWNNEDIELSLIYLAGIYILSINIPLLVITVRIFSKQLKDCKPELNYFDKEYAKDIVKLGGAFFWVQIMYMIIVITNEFLISLLVSPSMVVDYQIYNKVFSLIGVFFLLALTPVWSAVTKAISEQNFKWVNQLYKNLKIFALIAVILQFLMIPFLQLFIDIWLGKNSIEVNYFYCFIFAIYGSLFIWNGVISSIANGIGQLKTQTIWLTVGVIVKVGASWYFVDIFNSWIAIVIANIIAMSFYCVIQPFWLSRFLKEKELGGNNYV